MFISYKQSKYLHNIHKYPAKFFPELPRWLIEKYSNQNDIVLDPFAGSGTTNIEALLAKRNSVAIDIESFCQLLIKVKSTPIDIEVIEKYNKLLISEMKKYNHSIKYNFNVPNFPYRYALFNDYIINELDYILFHIQELCSNEQVKLFYLICFSSIIRNVSNADDSCTRTIIRKNREKQIYPSLAISKFIESVLINSYKMYEFYSEMIDNNSYIDIPINSDAKNINPDDYFDLTITSPPYVNAVDYPRTHQLELYWLELEHGSLRHLKEKHVGTECVLSKEYCELHKTGINEIDIVLEKIYCLDKRRSFIAYKYLMDMQENLREVYRVLKYGRKYIIVIGNNRIRDIIFETWKYLIPLAEQVGFKLDKWYASEIIKHFIKVPRNERINRDYIIEFTKE